MTTCPWCHSTAVDAEYVDIGVGEQRVSPYTCGACGAQELNPYHDNSRATAEELRKGWWKGQEGPNVEVARDVQAPAPPEMLLRTCADCERNLQRIKDQERRFQEARTSFEAQAKVITDANAQMKRTIANLQAERGALVMGDAASIRREREDHQRLTDDLKRQHAVAIADLKAQLEKALGKPSPTEPEGEGTRFSLLEVD